MGPNVQTHSRGFLFLRVMGVEGQISLSESSSEEVSRLSPQAGEVGVRIGRAAAAAARLCICCWET
jgi:hypothetical protein